MTMRVFFDISDHPFLSPPNVIRVTNPRVVHQIHALHASLRGHFFWERKVTRVQTLRLLLAHFNQNPPTEEWLESELKAIKAEVK